jgi:hypothetical protein
MLWLPLKAGRLLRSVKILLSQVPFVNAAYSDLIWEVWIAAFWQEWDRVVY